MKTFLDRHLKTNISVRGTIDTVLELVQKTVEDNGFFLEPLWFSRRTNSLRSFYVMLDDKKMGQKVCCGGIEFSIKKGGIVVVNLDSSKGIPGALSVDQGPLERFFYLVVQRFVQEDLLVTKKNK